MPSQFDHDKELQSYFTDVEHLRDLFKQWLAAPTLPKRLLVIHGVGGVGKSSLLRMFRLHAKSVRVPVALASGDEQKSALDVLTRWADDLTADGVALPAFNKTLAQYRALYLKVEDEAAKVAGKLTKDAAKTLVETAASTIPGFGPLVGKLGGMGVEALTDWLFSRGFKKPDVDLLLDPAKKLTEDFLADVTSAAGKQRLALMLDTFEQMEALSDWTRDVAQRLHSNILLVIAGRAVPNWDRIWHGWMANAQVEELKPMTEDDMRELVRRYYATLRGGEPDPKQVEAIIAFARGLPMVVTSAVQLWVKYGVEDFQAVKPEIVANLVDRLMEGVPKELVPALEAAAIVRWFDQPILRAVMQRDDVREVYNELRRFPFVRTRAEGLALHDAVRDIIDENLRVQDAERHRELHGRAAVYFEARLAKATGEEAERLGLERLYHRIRADEETGIQLFQEMAEELARYRMVNRLRALLNDVNTYPLERENSRLWREYYGARLTQLEGKHVEAEKVYQAISQNENAELKLRAYASCDWGELLVTTQRLREVGGVERAKRVIDQSLSYPVDSKLIWNYVSLGGLHARLAEDTKALENYNVALRFFRERGDNFLSARALIYMQDVFARQGNWKEMFLAYRSGLELIPPELEKSIARSAVLAYWKVAWAWAGRYADAEQDLQQAESIEYGLGLREFVGLNRDYGFILGMQGLPQAFERLEKAVSDALQKNYVLGEAVSSGFLGAVLLKTGRIQEAEQRLLHSLEVKKSVQAYRDIPEVLVWLGQLGEVKSHDKQIELQSAESYYQQAINLRWTKRYYFECGALTGLVRVKHAQGDYAAIPPLLAEAEQLAQQYEYNDHLASLRLTQGHLAWEGRGEAFPQGKLPSNQITPSENTLSQNGVSGNASPLRYYQHALIYALRYNRFLLDEVLSGRPQGTPLRPIIPECLKRGEEGRRMLIALRDWWQTGVNDIGTPRPDTISPIPEGIPLLEAERIARQREPGDGSPQKSVVEQIEAAL